MKATKANLLQFLDRPDPAIRLYLFYGPDEAGSRALANRLLAGLGGAEKNSLTAAAIKADSSLIAGEAAAMSLFGETRAVWIDPGGEELLPALPTLFDLDRAESVVIVIAGALKKSSGLLKAAEASAAALANVAYVPEGRDADALVIDMAQAMGLRARSDVAAAIAAAAGNDRAIIAQELSKFALYLDASPDRPQPLEHGTLEAVGASLADNDSHGLGDLALSGQIDRLCTELQNGPPGGHEPHSILRAMQRRVLMLAPLRARIESGERADAVMASMGKALFWKDKAVVQRLLNAWSADRLARVAEKIAALEREIFLGSSPSDAALGEALIGIARAATRG